jgi:hypothetical protein
LIDQVDERVSEWIHTLTNRTPSLTLPDVSRDQAEISLYLLDLVDDPLRRNSSRPPTQPVLRYLVSTSAPDPKLAHQILGQLLNAALENSEFEVELGPLSEKVWPSLGVSPRPAFILRVALPREFPPSDAKVVTVGAELGGAPVVDFFGLVQGPGQVPLAGARVEVPNLYRYAYADSRGRFRLAGVPAAPKIKTLLLTAKQKQQLFTIADTGTPEEPVVLTIEIP